MRPGAQNEHRERKHPPPPPPGDPRREVVSGKRWDSDTLAAENHDMPQTERSEHQRAGRTNREVGPVAKRQCHTSTTNQHGVDATTAYGNVLRAGMRNPMGTLDYHQRVRSNRPSGVVTSGHSTAMQSYQELLSSNHL